MRNILNFSIVIYIHNHFLKDNISAMVLLYIYQCRSLTSMNTHNMVSVSVRVGTQTQQTKVKNLISFFISFHFEKLKLN
jgi:hypothetical protein